MPASNRPPIPLTLVLPSSAPLLSPLQLRLLSLRVAPNPVSLFRPPAPSSATYSSNSRTPSDGTPANSNTALARTAKPRWLRSDLIRELWWEETAHLSALETKATSCGCRRTGRSRGLTTPYCRVSVDNLRHVSEAGAWSFYVHCARRAFLQLLTAGQEIETWVAALGHYDNNEFEEALKDFDNIADTSKILFNCGVIHATLGEHEKAVSAQNSRVPEGLWILTGNRSNATSALCVWTSTSPWPTSSRASPTSSWVILRKR